MKTSNFKAALLAAFTTLCFGASAWAQSAWPDRPIKLVVPYPAGGNADSTARLLATQLSDRLGQQVVVDNKPGGGGTIGATAVAKSPADGYTLLLDATAFTVNPSLFSKLAYDPAKDFAPISQITRVPMLLVVPTASPLKSTADLVRAAKASPGKLSYASAGNGGAQHLAAELFKQGTKVSMVHILPWRRACADGPGRRPTGPDVQRDIGIRKLRQGRQAARPGDHLRRALHGMARRADGG